MVSLVDKNAHPLISCTMGIHCTTAFSRCLYFDPFDPGLDGIIRIAAADNKIRMPVEVGILNQRPGMGGDTGSHHVREHAGENRRSEIVVQTWQAFALEKHVHIVEKVVDILHRNFKIGQAKLERQFPIQVESRPIHVLSSWQRYFQ